MAPPPVPFPKKELSEKNLILTYLTSPFFFFHFLVAYIVWVSVVPLLGLRRGGCTVLLPVFSHFIVIGGTYYREGGTSFCEDESIRPMSVILGDKDFALLFGFPSNLGIVVWTGEA